MCHNKKTNFINMKISKIPFPNKHYYAMLSKTTKFENNILKIEKVIEVSHNSQAWEGFLVQFSGASCLKLKSHFTWTRTPGLDSITVFKIQNWEIFKKLKRTDKTLNIRLKDCCKNSYALKYVFFVLHFLRNTQLESYD